MNIWDEVLAKVEAKVNRHSFATWFRPTTFLSLRESQLAIGVPNAQFKEWLAKNYQGVIGEALKLRMFCKRNEKAFSRLARRVLMCKEKH